MEDLLQLFGLVPTSTTFHSTLRGRTGRRANNPPRSMSAFITVTYDRSTPTPQHHSLALVGRDVDGLAFCVVNEISDAVWRAVQILPLRDESNFSILPPAPRSNIPPAQPPPSQQTPMVQLKKTRGFSMNHKKTKTQCGGEHIDT